MTQEDLEEILSHTNAAAAAYEALIIAPIKDTYITYGDFLEHANREFSRLGEKVSTILIKYIYATIWCYSNTPADEGDVIQIDLEKHGESGRQFVSKNLHLIGMYVFPLLLYGAEYIATAYTRLKPENLTEILDTQFPDMDDKLKAYDCLMSAIVEIAMQARFYYLRECFVREAIGDEEYRHLDQHDIPMPEGKIIIPED